MITHDDDFTSEVKKLPWIDRMIQDDHFIFKWSNRDTLYHLVASDFHNMWQEILNQEEIEERNSELNPNIEAPVQAVLSHLNNFIKASENGNCKIIELDRDCLQIQYDSNLGGIPFIWKFYLRQVSKEMFISQLTLPLIAMVSEQQRRITALCQELQNKDNEIEDYHMSGAKVSHRRLETKPFNESEFLQSSDQSEEMSLCISEAEKCSFPSSIQRLYGHVTNCLHQQTYKVLTEKVAVPKVEENKPPELESDNKTENSRLKKLKDSDKEVARRNELEKRLLEKQREKECKKKKKSFKL